MTLTTQTTGQRTAGTFRRLTGRLEVRMLVLAIVLACVLSLLSPYFLTGRTCSTSSTSRW